MELLLLLFGITLLAIPVMLFRAFVLFPYGARARGWKRALYAYKFSVVFSTVLVVYEAGTLSGFSWHRMRYVSDAELIQNAIQRAYPGIYDGVAALRVDYPGFEPQVRYWGSWHTDINADSLSERLLGFAKYQVKLPDAVVTLSVDGKAYTSLPCDGENCDVAAPAHPVFGLVGTVQMDAPAYDIVTDFRPVWADGSEGERFQSGHCFSAYSQADPSAALIINSVAAKPLEIRPRFGFYLVAARLVPRTEKDWVKGAYSQRRITLQEFLKWKSCGDAVKAEWPDIAGSWWKR